MLGSKLNEYRYLHNDESRVKEEFNEGQLDLNFRLSFFHEKVSKTNNKDLMNRFENTMGQYMPNQKSNSDTDLSQADSNDSEPVQIKEKIDSPKWVKKLYRKIALMTHPDKIDSLPTEGIKKLMRGYFETASDGYVSGNISDVMLVAFDLQIDMEETKEKVDIVANAIKQKKKSIHEKMSSLAYQWYHIKEENRNKYFKNILNSLGFIYTEEEIETVIKKKRPVADARKPGERPKKGVLGRKRK